MRKQEEGWLAKKIHRTPSSGKNKCKEEFLTNLVEIKIALKTCTIHAVWQMLVKLKLYTGTYVSFWKLVQKYCPQKKLSSLQQPANGQRMEPAVTKPTCEEKGTHSPTTIKPVSWQNQPSLPKRELILDGKPMNSNGETID